MIFSLEQGLSHLDLELPQEKVLGVLGGRDFPGLDPATITRTLSREIREQAPTDLSKKSTAVIIPDDTRLWARGDIFVPVIIDALTAVGADPKRITVIIALGTHKEIPPSGFDALSGSGTRDRVRVINSAGLDPDRLVAIGTTPAGTPLTVTREAFEADHIIIFGGVLHHMLAGFGGGRKYILPGIAGNDAIQANHSLAMDKSGMAHPLVRQGISQGNPVSEDMKAGADLFLKNKTCTYAAVAANGQGEIFYARAGDLHSTFDAACRELDMACCVDVDEPADFIVFSAGGHRTDTQLYQATKALFNAVNVAKPGAILVFVAGCTAGIGNPDFARALSLYKNCPETLGQKLARNFHMPAYVAFRVMDMLKQFQVFLVSHLDKETTLNLGFQYTATPNKLVKDLPGLGYIIPFAENILPRVAESGQ